MLGARVERYQCRFPVVRALNPTVAEEADMASQYQDHHQFYVCRQCGYQITAPQWQIAVGESHEHVQCNPFGITFVFGCFSEAAGCGVIGAPQDAHSWFPGFFWRIAHCQQCGEHMGWFFAGNRDPFFGIILQRIRLQDTPTQ